MLSQRCLDPRSIRTLAGCARNLLEPPLRKSLSFDTPGRGPLEITAAVAGAIRGQSGEAVCQLFLCHTSASLLIVENADPQVLMDLEAWLARAVPDGDALYRHTAEGPDDMPAHVRSVLCGVSLAIPVSQGRLQLGTWQGIFLWEHRGAPHRRELLLSLMPV